MRLHHLNSYLVTPRCTLVITPPRFFDVHYSQCFINLWNVKPNESVLNIPIGPPLPRHFQIFQFRMTSESTETEFSLHSVPYEKCKAINWIFRCHLSVEDEMAQETWLIKPNSVADEPYLYFSFKELAGKAPNPIRLEMRICD